MKSSNLTIISLAYGGILLTLSGWWLFNIDRTPVNRCLSILWLPLFVMLVVSISRGTSEIRKSAPLWINLTVIGLLIGLVVFRAYWDLDFILYGNEYSSASSVVNLDELVFSDEDGISLKLPQQYSHLARFGEISVTHDIDNTTILIVFPETPGDLDGLMTAYVYVAGKTVSNIPAKCLSGRLVNPHREHWYYCVVSENQVR
jgi:hypothetical protein